MNASVRSVVTVALARLSLAMALLIVILLASSSEQPSIAQESPAVRPSELEGPGHTNQLINLTGDSGRGLSESTDSVRILINTSGSGPLTGIDPVAEKDYWFGLLAGNPDYIVDWYDGTPTYNLLDAYDMVIYDAGGYWYPVSAQVEPLWQYHFSGRPLIAVVPDINYDWDHIKASSRPNFSEEVLYIGGVRGILPTSAFAVFANTGHEIVAPMGTNTEVPVASDSSWPDSFDPVAGAAGVLRQGDAAIEFDRGTVAENPTLFSFGPSGNLYSVIAFPGTDDEGRVVVFGFPPTAIEDSAMLDQLSASSVNYALQSTASVRNVRLDNLYVDDASTHAWVYKTAGSKVDIVAVVTNDEQVPREVTVTVSVPADWTLDNECFVRSDPSGSDRQSIQCVSLGSGQHQVTASLAPGTKQFGLRFTIADSPVGVCIQISGDIALTEGLPLVPHRERWLDITDSAQAIIVTNRRLLYDNYDKTQVTSLLTYLTEIADGGSSGEVPAVIYYADWYSDVIRNWDNTQVVYPDPPNTTTTNAVAHALEALIGDWAGDLDADYLMIVGGDEIIPFFRVWDGDLANFEYQMPNYDSDYNLNQPAFTAIRNNYFLSDAKYSDLTGDDWLEGELELAGGRIVGVDANDLRALVERGLQAPGSSPNAVVASDTRNDVNSIVSHLENRGMDILNDGDPDDTTESDSWSVTTLTAAMSNGFKIFAHSSHGDYDYLAAPVTPTRFYASQVAGTGNIPANRPLVSTSGCHSGLLGDTDGSPSPDDNMVWAFVREGSSGVLASSAFVYLAPFDLVGDGEEWFNDFYKELAPTDWLPFHDPPTRTVGEAYRLACRNYSAGLGWNGKEKRSVVQFLYYGVPWMKPTYPSDQALPSTDATMMAGYAVEMSEGVAAVDEASSRIFDFNLGSYEIVEVDGYDLVTIPGAEQDLSDYKPVLPVIHGPIVKLPVGSTIVSLNILSGSSSSLGTYRIPSYQSSSTIEPVPAFVDTTDVEGTYPSPNYGYEISHFPDHTEVRILFYPVQYNPQTQETALWTSASLELTYDSPSPAVISAFFSDETQYHVGDAINTTTIVENVSAIDLMGLVVHMSVKDLLGEVQGTTSSSAFDVPSGGSVEIPIPFSGAPADGTFLLAVEVQDATYTPLARSSTFVHISSGEITGFSVPSEVLQQTGGVDIPFTITYHNHRPIPVEADGSVRIYNSKGQEVAHLLTTPIIVGANSSAVFQLFWNSLNKPDGVYRAAAQVTTADGNYGPTSADFRIRWIQIYLPLIQRN